MDIDFVGRPWHFVKALLNDTNIRYNVTVTHPTKDFFKLEPDDYYVVRQRVLDDGTVDIKLAARLLKEVSSNGVQD
ncbi:aliphatic sulfonate ABC transporter [Anaerovibrio sp.]|uniref:aliphatic sulfonate ABC transporter n=1 Tax=Anaerovibrio sp. TaxID=1872532 RepID=UPI001B75E309|nr:aliphatic sulfonate ABC transporter [Anaerovibrio sp.]MBP3232234.1 aliphatic sulfonate ABC transporter [Anaerovibrio sp.]MBR2143284.1 aliphatic sulfonate ABC transporter [Anaerovibrio sp.]